MNGIMMRMPVCPRYFRAWSAAASTAYEAIEVTAMAGEGNQRKLEKRGEGRAHRPSQGGPTL
jgi:hypothetical protein